jgi:hypothetical protein
MPEIIKFSQIRLSETETAENKNTRLNVSSPRCAWGENKFRSREDEISFGRWRLGFIVFYGTAALLLGGLAVTADRLSMVASTAAPVASAIVNR